MHHQPSASPTPTRMRFQLTEGRRLEADATHALPARSQVWEIGAEPLVLIRANDEIAVRFDEGAAFRMTLGGEVPDPRSVEVVLAKSGRRLGCIDVRYGCTFQPFSLALDPEAARSAAAEGLALRASEPHKAVPLLVPQAGLAEKAPGLRPHLLALEKDPTPELRWRRFETALASLQTLQPFNWIEGCVLDGLRSSGAEAALADHLDYYFPNGHLQYAGPRGEPRSDEIFGIEALLPFAFLPSRHPGCRLMEDFVAAKTGVDGLILDRGEDAEGRPRAFTEITIEGCYTLSYPLAVACRRDGRNDWSDLAWAQIEARTRHLVRDGVVAQRARLGGAPEQADWARAFGWFLIGVARTAGILGRPPRATAEAFREVTRRALSLRRPDGLWSVYLGEADTGTDTSGSAAISAGLALGARLGLVDDVAACIEAARGTVSALGRHLSSEGLLGGVAQLNRGGEALQRGNFRVHAPFAMGLLASARAALNAGSPADA